MMFLLIKQANGLELNEEEKALFDASAKSVKENEDMLDELEILG